MALKLFSLFPFYLDKIGKSTKTPLLFLICIPTSLLLVFAIVFSFTNTNAFAFIGLFISTLSTGLAISCILLPSLFHTQQIPILSIIHPISSIAFEFIFVYGTKTSLPLSTTASYYIGLFLCSLLSTIYFLHQPHHTSEKLESIKTDLELGVTIQLDVKIEGHPLEKIEPDEADETRESHIDHSRVQSSNSTSNLDVEDEKTNEVSCSLIGTLANETTTFYASHPLVAIASSRGSVATSILSSEQRIKVSNKSEFSPSLPTLKQALIVLRVTLLTCCPFIQIVFSLYFGSLWAALPSFYLRLFLCFSYPLFIQTFRSLSILFNPWVGSSHIVWEIYHGIFASLPYRIVLTYISATVEDMELVIEIFSQYMFLYCFRSFKIVPNVSSTVLKKKNAIYSKLPFLSVKPYSKQYWSDWVKFQSVLFYLHSAIDLCAIFTIGPLFITGLLLSIAFPNSNFIPLIPKGRTIGMQLLTIILIHTGSVVFELLYFSFFPKYVLETLHPDFKHKVYGATFFKVIEYPFLIGLISGTLVLTTLFFYFTNLV